MRNNTTNQKKLVSNSNIKKLTIMLCIIIALGYIAFQNWLGFNFIIG